MLALSRTGKRDELEARLWRGQLDVLFPLIESERVTFVDMMEPQLEAILENEKIEQFGRQVTDPYDLEIGTLRYLTVRSANRLYPPEAFMRDRLKLLRDCRNNLAHHTTCEPERVTSPLREKPISR